MIDSVYRKETKIDLGYLAHSKQAIGMAIIIFVHQTSVHPLITSKELRLDPRGVKNARMRPLRPRWDGKECGRHQTRSTLTRKPVNYRSHRSSSPWYCGRARDCSTQDTLVVVVGKVRRHSYGVMTNLGSCIEVGTEKPFIHLQAAGGADVEYNSGP